MAKKNIRVDSTYLLSNDSADNPILGARVLDDGRERLFLDYYYGYEWVESKTTGKKYKKAQRKRRALDLYLWTAPRTPQERQQNKDIIELAKKIRFEESQKLIEGSEGYRLRSSEDSNFLDWMWSYYERYTKKDKRHIKRAYDQFKCFLSESEDYKQFSSMLKPAQLTKQMVTAFTEFLQKKYTGEGPHTTYCRFKKIIKAAVEADVLRKNPCTGVSIRIDRNKLPKDILSLEEMQQLIETKVDRQSDNIRRAFIFSLYTGLRWCDVNDLTYGEIDFGNRILKFDQNKTEGHSSASWVTQKLTPYLIELVGQAETNDPRNELVFKLPSYTMCTKSLKRWVEHSGIKKHITWHCARHTFATTILNQGANPKTAASLLGHSNLQYIDKYLRAVDALKAQAMESIPVFEVPKPETEKDHEQER